MLAAIDLNNQGNKTEFENLMIELYFSRDFVVVKEIVELLSWKFQVYNDVMLDK